MTEIWRLFRYRRINEFLWDELERSRFYCCSPTNLNDPFDCRVEWRASLRRASELDGVSDERRNVLASIESEIAGGNDPTTVGVCCFTCKLDDHLMWAHYADSHRGVCLMYEIPGNYFMDRYKPESGNPFFFVGGSPVSYGNAVLQEWLTGGDLDAPTPGEPAENAITRIWSSKSKAWEHEEEFRVVTSQPGFLEFAPSFLKQVAFGLGVPDAQRELIGQVARRGSAKVSLVALAKDPATDFGYTYPGV